MNKSKYLELKRNPPKLLVKKGAREVIITTVASMCDNIHYLIFKKNSEGDFELNGNGFSLSNFQMKYPPHDLKWAADEEKWDTVFSMINSGVQVVSEVKSR